MTELQRLRNLEVPTGNIDCVLDTDTYNEIDDQYALSLMIKSPKLNLRAIYAARSSTRTPHRRRTAWSAATTRFEAAHPDGQRGQKSRRVQRLPHLPAG